MGSKRLVTQKPRAEEWLPEAKRTEGVGIGVDGEMLSLGGTKFKCSMPSMINIITSIHCKS